MKLLVILFTFFSGVLLTSMSYAQQNTQYENASANSQIVHSGGTDYCGCHHNRRTGQYHCHTRKQRGGSCPA